MDREGGKKDFAIGTVLTAPVPATTGLSVTLQSGEGALMPTPPFMATAAPNGAYPTLSNSEKIWVTAIVGDTLTIQRGKSPTTAKTIAAGWVIANGIYAEDFEGAMVVVQPNEPTNKDLLWYDTDDEGLMPPTGNADTVDTFHANATPTAGQLLPLNSNKRFPNSVIGRQSGASTVAVIGASGERFIDFVFATPYATPPKVFVSVNHVTGNSTEGFGSFVVATALTITTGGFRMYLKNFSTNATGGGIFGVWEATDN